METLTTTARLDRHTEVWYGARRLCRYNARPHMTDLQGPRPYFHPISTLGGNIVTTEKHYDHEWHNGLSLACPWVSGYNFWGGPTYVRGQGYQRLNNLGHQTHRALEWESTSGAGLEKRWTHRLEWLTPDAPGVPFLREERRLGVGQVNAAAGHWCLDFDFALFNPGAEIVKFGSPTTEGRPLAGYGGVFWRGPLEMLHGTIRMADGRSGSGADLMGERSAWLAYVGRHASTGRTSTLVFLDHPDNVRFPLRWFVRSEQFPVVSYAFSFDEYLDVAPQATLRRRHRVAICDGDRTHDEIQALYAQWLGTP